MFYLEYLFKNLVIVLKLLLKGEWRRVFLALYARVYQKAYHVIFPLKVPKLRRQTFETAIIERYRRRETSVEEALIEMYLAGVSVRRVEDITEALWGTRVSPSTVSDLNKKIYETIDVWRNRPKRRIWITSQSLAGSLIRTTR